MPKLTRDYVAAVFDQARKHGKLTMAHIVELADAKMAVDEGVNILVHNVRDQDLPADFIATLKARNVSVISTLAREEGMFTAGGGATDNPFFTKGLSPEQVAELKKKLDALANDPTQRLTRAFEQDSQRQTLGRRHPARIGTDRAARPALHPGFFEHRQMGCCWQRPHPMQVIRPSREKNNSGSIGIDKFRHARPGQGRRPAGARQGTARRHHQHAHDGSRLSRR